MGAHIPESDEKIPAIRLAVDRCAELADGADSTADPSYSKRLPMSAGAKVGEIVEALIAANVETPEQFARILRAADVRCYSDALWRVLSAYVQFLEPEPSWEEVFERLEHAENVKSWAEREEDGLYALLELVTATQGRGCISPDEADPIGEMARAFTALLEEGSLPSDEWAIELHLSVRNQQSRGTRTYRISIGEDSIRADCHGTEWQEEVGTDSWQGPEFVYEPLGETESSVDMLEFSGEWRDALRNAEYTLGIELNGDRICDVPSERVADSESGRACNRVLRAVVMDLQQIEATLSGEDAVLENAWDEICVQRQSEESIYWAVYEETIRTIIHGAVLELSAEDVGLLWQRTPESDGWDAEQDGEPIPARSDIEEWLYEELLSIADSYANRRIRAYLDRPLD